MASPLPEHTLQLSHKGDIHVTQMISDDPKFYYIKTLFHVDGEEEDGKAVFRVRKGADLQKCIAAIELHWKDICQELEEIKKEAIRYASVKSRGKPDPLLVEHLIMMGVEDFGESYFNDFHRSSKKSRSLFVSQEPVTCLGTRFISFRDGLTDKNNADREMAKGSKDRALLKGQPKPDNVEKLIRAIEEKLNKTKDRLEKLIDDDCDDDELPGGGVAMADAVSTRYSPDNPLFRQYMDFCRNTEHVLDCCNHAWWESALHIHKNKPLDPGYLNQQANTAHAFLQRAKGAYARMQEMAAELPEGYKFQDTDPMVLADDAHHSGIFTKLQKLLSLIKNDNLLKTEIEAGMGQTRGK